jgi:hypothetical protein
MALPDFPAVNTAAISELAAMLRLIASGAADVGIDTRNLRDAVVGHQVWQGNASQQWQAVVTERIGDAGLTNEVMGTAADKLAALASDVDDERALYNRLSNEILVAQSKAIDPIGLPPPELVDPTGVDGLRNSVTRVQGLLDQAAKDLLALAILAGDIRARPAANRTPGVADGANRAKASQQLLTMLFGSVIDNQLSGAAFEKTVLNELGIPKNTEVWRPDPPFEGRLTLGGLAKGTSSDGLGANFLLEIKATDSQTVRYQLRLEAEYARQSGRPLWIIKQGTKPVTDNLTRLAEGTKGGVLYRVGPNTYVDGYGNPVHVAYDKAINQLDLQGYVSTTQPEGGTGPVDVAPPDPSAPSSPVDPAIADDGGAGGTATVPVEPVDPVEPIDPIDPVIP